MVRSCGGATTITRAPNGPPSPTLPSTKEAAQAGITHERLQPQWAWDNIMRVYELQDNDTTTIKEDLLGMTTEGPRPPSLVHRLPCTCK
jgi:hypothetical protein